MKQVFLFSTLILFLSIYFLITTPVYAGFWPVESIDTMKFSRDISREPDVLKRIPAYVQAVAALHPNYITVATPYDEEFYPVLKTWVTEIRKYNIHIWFRGNWSSWEGWFGYPKFKDYKEHHQKTYDFLLKHGDLLADGDIFTPAPEPENGGLGDPRGSQEKTKLFLEFLVDSYTTCEKGINQIHKKVFCGYFSVNGDVARDILTPDVVRKTGNVVVIDHYVKTAEKLKQDIIYLHNKYQAPIVLGEFGAPIPDIHGEMTDAEQSAYVGDTYAMLLSLGNIVRGVNYWTAFGGSTHLFENDLEPRLVATTIERFYHPPKLLGTITDQFGNKLAGATISFADGSIQTTTNEFGKYEIAFPGTFMRMSVKQSGPYETFDEQVNSNGNDIQIKNIILIRDANWFTRIGLVLRGIMTKIQAIFSQN